VRLRATATMYWLAGCQRGSLILFAWFPTPHIPRVAATLPTSSSAPGRAHHLPCCARAWTFAVARTPYPLFHAQVLKGQVQARAFLPTRPSPPPPRAPSSCQSTLWPPWAGIGRLKWAGWAPPKGLASKAAAASGSQAPPRMARLQERGTRCVASWPPGIVVRVHMRGFAFRV